MKQERYRTIETYSTGMRQKIKFAAAIVHDPDFLIFDEPTSGLDPEEREALAQSNSTAERTSWKIGADFHAHSSRRSSDLRRRVDPVARPRPAERFAG